MLKNEWIAIVAVIGGYLYLYFSNNYSFANIENWKLAVPLVIGLVALKWDDLFKVVQQKSQLEQPNRIIERLMGEEGEGFRERFDILDFTEFNDVFLHKNSIYKFIITDKVHGERVLLTPAIKGTELTVFVHGPGDTLREGFAVEKDYISQMMPKEKPSALDLLEMIPEEQRGGYASRFIEKEEKK